MSIEAAKWAWNQDVSPSEKLVLLALANYGETSFPSVELIAKMTGLSTRSVIRATKTLAAAGLLAIEKVRGREFSHNVYTLGKCHSVTVSEITLNKYPKDLRVIKDRVTPCHLPADFSLSPENRRLAAKLKNYYPPPDSIEDAFRDWCLAHGHKSYNWQKSARSYMEGLLNDAHQGSKQNANSPGFFN